MNTYKKIIGYITAIASLCLYAYVAFANNPQDWCKTFVYVMVFISNVAGVFVLLVTTLCYVLWDYIKVQKLDDFKDKIDEYKKKRLWNTAHVILFIVLLYFCGYYKTVIFKIFMVIHCKIYMTVIESKLKSIGEVKVSIIPKNEKKRKQ